MIDAACNKRCIGEGQQAILVTGETGELLLISNTGFVKKYAGAHIGRGEKYLEGWADYRQGRRTAGQVDPDARGWT